MYIEKNPRQDEVKVLILNLKRNQFFFYVNFCLNFDHKAKNSLF